MLKGARDRGQRLASALTGAWRAKGQSKAVPVDRDLCHLMFRHGAAALGFRVAGENLSHEQSVMRLQDAYRWNALSAYRHEVRLARVMRAMSESGVQAITGKGWAVAREYPSPGLRPCGDIDLYATKSDAARAASVLTALPDVAVDLHRGYADLDDRDEAEIHRRSRTERVEGVEVRFFGPEDHLRLICVHTVRHGVLRALWLCDVALLVEGLPPGFDVRYFTAGDSLRTEGALAVLGLARALLGARLDRLGLPAARLRPPAWMPDAILAEWGRARSPHGLRENFRHEILRPWRWPRALALRWPNPVEAAYETGTPLHQGGSLRVQLAACVSRIRRFPNRTETDGTDSRSGAPAANASSTSPRGRRKAPR